MFMNWQQRRSILMGFGPVLQAAGEGAGGGGEGGGEDGDAGGADEGGAGGGDTGGGGSILDLATGDKAAEGEGGEYAAPDYLPEHLRGKDADETMTKLHTAYKGARDAMAKGKGGAAADLPEKSDGYAFTDKGSEAEPDKVFAELTSEASAPMIALAQKAAHKAGIGGAAFDGFMRDFVAGAAESGLPIGVSDEEAQSISAEAEMERLTEIVGSGLEASTLVNTVSGYAHKLVDRGVIASEDLAEFGQMVGTAEGAHIFYKIMTAELGEKPIPLADGGAGNMTGNDAYALHAKASSMADGAEKTAAMDAANKAMQKAFGQESTGSVRSSVL